MRNLLVLLILVSCSKAQPPDGIYLKTTIGSAYSIATISSEPFCGRRLYSFKGGDLLISLIADSLKSGSYEAGMNWWGHMTDNIHLNLSVEKGIVSGSFSGDNSSGRLINLKSY
jgi:hypothetical protein